MDAKGVHYRAHDVRGFSGFPPWLDDRVKTIAPDYPYDEQRKHHEGRAMIRLFLDLRTGAVIQAKILQSTGFAALDESAVSALRQWRWRPARWKEIDLPVTYRLPAGYSPPPQGSVPLAR